MPATRIGEGAAVNDEHAELVEAGYRALAELQHMHEAAIEVLVTEILQRTGTKLLVRQPGVLDASYEDLARMAAQAAHYGEAWRLIGGWLRPTDIRTLGAVLKVMPAQQAHEITGLLRAAGVLAGGGVRPSP
jgi:hypothetical protein